MSNFDHFIDRAMTIREVCDELSKIQEGLFDSAGYPSSRLSTLEGSTQGRFVRGFSRLCNYARAVKTDLADRNRDFCSKDVRHLLNKIDQLMKMICRLPEANKQALHDVMQSFDRLLGILIRLNEYLGHIEVDLMVTLKLA
jgi:hypothetical protein